MEVGLRPIKFRFKRAFNGLKGYMGSTRLGFAGDHLDPILARWALLVIGYNWFPKLFNF